MPPRFFGGTIQTLANLVQREQEQNFLKQSPQYQQAIFNLTQAKQRQATLEALNQQILQADPSEVPNIIARGAAQMGEFGPALQQARILEEREISARKTREQRRLAVPALHRTYEDISSEETTKFIEKGDVSFLAGKKIRARPLFNPFQRALYTTLGTQAGRARVSLEGVEAIAGDVLDVINQFQKIPSTLRGPASGRTLGQIAKLGEPNVVTYEDTKELTLSNIAKQLGGEVGVLTDRDIARISRSLPSVVDTDETANNKIRFVLNYIDRRVRAKQAVARLPETGLNLSSQWFDPRVDPDKTTVRQYINRLPSRQPERIPISSQPATSEQIQQDTTAVVPEETPSQQYIQQLRQQGLIP